MTILGGIFFIVRLLLKILLLLLLVLLAALVLLLVLPVRYEATGRAGGAVFGEDLEAHGKVSALFGLAVFRLIFRGGDLLYSFRIGGKTIRKGLRRGKKKEASDAEDESARPADFSESDEEEFLPRGEEDGTERKAGEGEVVSFSEEPMEDEEPRPPEEAEPSAEPEKKTGRRGKRAGGWHTDSPEPEESRLQKLWEKWDRLQEPDFQKTLARLKRAAGSLIRHVLPQVLKGRAVIGTGDPASTGQLVGLFYACWPLYADTWDLALSGDFEEKRLQGKLYMKGRIRLAFPAGTALGLLADKNIRRMIWSRRKRKKK